MNSDDLFVTGHDHNIDLSINSDTQPEITHSQFNDEDMLHLIKSSFGQLDKKTFKQELLKTTDVDDLRPIRKSLFDLVRKQEQTYADTKLVERTQRDNGQTVSEKLAEDVYVIFQYLQGANNEPDLRQCFSRSRRATVTSDDNDAIISDIFNKLSNKTNIKNSENSVVISLLMEVKQMITDCMKPMSDKINKLSQNFENELATMEAKLTEKDMTITNLKCQITDNKDTIAKLRSELILQAEKWTKQRSDNEDSCQGHDIVQEQVVQHDNTVKYKQKKTQESRTYSDVISNNSSRTDNTSVLKSMETNGEQQDEYVTFQNYNINSIDFSTLSTNKMSEDNSPISSFERRIETKVTDGDTTIFRGVVRRRTKRIVLYNVIADKPFELVNSAVRTYAAQKGVHITFTKLLKRCESRGKSINIMRVNLNEDDFYDKIECDFDNFWPEGIYWRDYVPYNRNGVNNNQQEKKWSRKGLLTFF